MNVVGLGDGVEDKNGESDRELGVLQVMGERERGE